MNTDLSILSIFNDIQDLQTIIAILKRETYQSKIFWYLYKMALKDARPILGGGQSIDIIRMHINLHGLILDQDQEKAIDSVPAMKVYEMFTDRICWKHCARAMKEVADTGFVDIEKNNLRRFIKLKFQYVCQLHYALKAGHLVPYQDIDYTKF